jgi:hypothetical protein
MRVLSAPWRVPQGIGRNKGPPYITNVGLVSQGLSIAPVGMPVRVHKLA